MITEVEPQKSSDEQEGDIDPQWFLHRSIGILETFFGQEGAREYIAQLNKCGGDQSAMSGTMMAIYLDLPEQDRDRFFEVMTEVIESQGKTA